MKTITAPTEQVCRERRSPIEPAIKLMKIGGQSVYVTSVPSRAGKKDRHVRHAEHLQLSISLWNRFHEDLCFPCAERADDISVLSHDLLGKPELTNGRNKKASVSFSRASSATWAALGVPCRSVGIDAAEPDEFSGSYPFRRVFHDSEFLIASDCGIHPEDTKTAAAVLWSAKEAAAKALGCGFHFMDPGDVRITEMHSSKSGTMSMRAYISDKGLEKLSLFFGIMIDVVSFSNGKMWVSISSIPSILLPSRRMELLGACTIN